VPSDFPSRRSGVHNLGNDQIGRPSDLFDNPVLATMYDRFSILVADLDVAPLPEFTATGVDASA